MHETVISVFLGTKLTKMEAELIFVFFFLDNLPRFAMLTPVSVVCQCL